MNEYQIEVETTRALEEGLRVCIVTNTYRMSNHLKGCLLVSGVRPTVIRDLVTFLVYGSATCGSSFDRILVSDEFYEAPLGLADRGRWLVNFRCRLMPPREKPPL